MAVREKRTKTYGLAVPDGAQASGGVRALPALRPWPQTSPDPGKDIRQAARIGGRPFAGRPPRRLASASRPAPSTLYSVK